MSKSVLHTSLCDDLKIEYPLFLAGMGVKGKATPPELVAAVSDAGGMGVLGCSWLDADENSSPNPCRAQSDRQALRRRSITACEYGRYGGPRPRRDAGTH